MPQLMKIFLYIFLPVFILDLVFDGEQIIKFPFLIQHYTDHKQENKIDFIDFLILHYVEKHAQSNEHEELPFKDHHNCSHIHLYYDKIQKVHIFYSSFGHLKYKIVQINNIKSSSCFSVWHPPKVFSFC